ncbi:MAG: hypothetical protein HY040_07005 [Planctomycetes bacterium]|nr:hypothetical protein [Planctomycetota bacterium]
MFSMFAALLFLVNFAVTWFLVGMSWFVQIVHYPLIKGAFEESFVLYEKAHSNLSTYIVMPVMILELVTAALLVLIHPRTFTPGEALFGLALVGVIWGITAWLHVPAHQRLMRGYEEDAHQRLLVSNWLRIVAWTLRGVLLLFACYRMLVERTM